MARPSGEALPVAVGPAAEEDDVIMEAEFDVDASISYMTCALTLLLLATV